MKKRISLISLMKIGLALCVGVFATQTFASGKSSEPVAQTEKAAAEKAVEKAVAKTEAEKTTTADNKTASQPNLVNINLASAAELQDKLVGIGAKKAQAIVEYREKHGKFVSLEQLTEVSGIGKATLEKNRDRIVLE